MFNIRSILCIAILVLSAACCGSAFAVQQSTTTNAGDNTGVNKTEMQLNEPNAGDQSGSVTDRELSKRIRRAIVDDKTLSAYAHNVKIITVKGVVTLKGPVRSESEKTAVVKKATALAGEGKVVDQLDIAEKK